MSDVLHAQLPIINRLGLHARASAKVVSVASRYNASIRLRFNNREVDAKNMMGLLTLAAGCGSLVEVMVEGEHAAEAMEELRNLFARRFDEEQ